MPQLSDYFGGFLKAVDIKSRGGRVKATIAGYEEVEFKDGKKLIIHFENASKGLVLNKINGKLIAQVAKTENLDEWKGVEIALISTKTEFQGDLVDCIRVDAPSVSSSAPAPTAQATELTEDDIPF